MAVVSEHVAVSLSAAAAAVAAVVLVAVASDSVVPSLLEPQSSQFRGPMSWPRDSYLGRVQVCRPSPTRRLPSRIPEPSEVVLDWSLTDSAVWCRLAEAASVFGVEPSPWARLEPPEERSCELKNPIHILFLSCTKK